MMPDALHLLELQYDCEHPSVRHPRVYVLLPPPHHPDAPAHYAPADTLVPLRVFETVASGGFTHTLSAADAAVIDAVASSVSSSRSPSLSYLSTPATSVSPSPPPKATILCETEHFRQQPSSMPQTPRASSSSRDPTSKNKYATGLVASSRYARYDAPKIFQIPHPRSRTSGSVLQTTLCYLEAIRPKVPELMRKEQAGVGARSEPDMDFRVTPATVAKSHKMLQNAAKITQVIADEEDMACTATPSNSFDTALKKPKAPSSFRVWRTPGRRHIQTTECRCGALQRAVAPQPWPLPAHFSRGVQCRVLYEEKVLEQLPSHLRSEFPAFLTHRSGIDKTLMTLIRSTIAQGLTPNAWERVLRKLHVRNRDLAELSYLHALKANGYAGFSPSCWYINTIFVEYMGHIKPHLDQSMAAIPASTVSWDHSHKAVKYIA
ncbi:hypothetical protein C8J57DRAFT_1710667 [Mycena rebaudengoi]|nr:hypothetical protein C8J57DRAFT_1710667 [Mycena rebaudengoi]